jgi:hypothetical protein
MLVGVLVWRCNLEQDCWLLGAPAGAPQCTTALMRMCLSCRYYGPCEVMAGCFRMAALTLLVVIVLPARCPWTRSPCYVPSQFVCEASFRSVVRDAITTCLQELPRHLGLEQAAHANVLGANLTQTVLEASSTSS